jgi:LPS sulfotransferase NodH
MGGKACLDPPKKTPEPNKFVIFGQGRTGSTLLRLMLNQHPNVTCEGGLFQHFNKTPLITLEGRSRLFRHESYGFKLLSHQPTKFLKYNQAKDFLKQLHNNRWKIIYLRRDDTFRHALSILTAKEWGYIFKKPTDVNNLPKLTIDKEEMAKTITKLKRSKEDDLETLKDLPYKELVYEKDLADKEDRKRSLPEVFDYIGVFSNFKPKSPVVKVIPEDPSIMIKNFHDLSEKYGK